MKKIYQNPTLVVLDVKLHGILCEVSGNYDSNSIQNAGTEDMVKAQRNSNFQGNPVVWEDWQ